MHMERERMNGADHHMKGKVCEFLMAARSVHLLFCCRDKIIIVGSQLVGFA